MMLASLMVDSDNRKKNLLKTGSVDICKTQLCWFGRSDNVKSLAYQWLHNMIATLLLSNKNAFQ